MANIFDQSNWETEIERIQKRLGIRRSQVASTKRRIEERYRSRGIQGGFVTREQQEAVKGALLPLQEKLQDLRRARAQESAKEEVIQQQLRDRFADLQLTRFISPADIATLAGVRSGRLAREAAIPVEEKLRDLQKRGVGQFGAVQGSQKTEMSRMDAAILRVLDNPVGTAPGQRGPKGESYVLTFADDTGVKRDKAFGSLGEAQEFARNRRLPIQLTGSPDLGVSDALRRELERGTITRIPVRDALQRVKGYAQLGVKDIVGAARLGGRRSTKTGFTGKKKTVTQAIPSSGAKYTEYGMVRAQAAYGPTVQGRTQDDIDKWNAIIDAQIYGGLEEEIRNQEKFWRA